MTVPPTTRPAIRPAGRPRRAVVLAVEHGIDDFYQGVVPALVPLLILVRHYDYTRAGGIVLAATLLSSVAQPAFGLLADRVPMPWLRTAGLLVAAGGIGIVGFTASYPATWFAVLLSGLGVAAYHPEAARAVHATATGDRGMGWFAFGGLAGYAAGAPVTALVLTRLGLGATVLLAAPALLMAGATVVDARRVRNRGADPAGGPLPAGGEVRRPEDWARFSWLTAVVMVRSVCFYGLSAFLVVFLTTARDAGPLAATLALSLFSGLGALATLLSSRVTARLGRVRTLLVGYVVAGVLLAGLLLAQDVVAAVVLAGLLGAALHVPVPVQITLGQTYLHRHLGLASAITLGLANSTGGLASPVLGALADHRGITTAFAVLLALPVLAAVLAARLRSGR